MFTVRQQYVKPLEVIWVKCAALGWGPHNTVHVDDLERNFELNKQSGVLISPFHLKPFAIDQSTGDTSGESSLDGTTTTVLPPCFEINDFEESSMDSNSSSNNPLLLDNRNGGTQTQPNPTDQQELNNNGFLVNRNGSQQDQNRNQNIISQNGNNGGAQEEGKNSLRQGQGGQSLSQSQNGLQNINGVLDAHNGLQKVDKGLEDGLKILQEGQNGSFEGPEGTYSLPYINGSEHGSGATDDVCRNKSFDDIELQLLAR